MKTHVQTLLCILLIPAVDAAVTLVIGTLALPLMGQEPLRVFAIYALSLLIASITGYLTMNLLRQELFTEIDARTLRHAWFHGWGKDVGPIRSVGEGVRLGLVVVAAGCGSLMTVEGYPSISEEAWPLVLLGAAFIAILAYAFLFVGWHRASREREGG